MKYKCNTCNHHFEGDLSTISCPQCGSEDISEDKKRFPWWVWLLAIILVGLIIWGIATISNRTIIVSGEINEDTQELRVTVEQISLSNLKKNYELKYTIDGSETPQDFYYDENSNTFVSKMLPNTYYIITLKCKQNNGRDISYKNGNSFYLEIETEDDEKTPAPPLQIIDIKSEPDATTQTYTVTIFIDSPDSFPNVTYTLAGITQQSNIFTGIKPGYYTPSVENNGTSAEGQLELDSFPKAVNPITKTIIHISKADVQAAFDRACKDPMTVPSSNTKLTSGPVKLKKPYPKSGIDNLYAALLDAAQNGTKYTVISFQTDGLGKIKSGTLELE